MLIIQGVFLINAFIVNAFIYYAYINKCNIVNLVANPTVQTIRLHHNVSLRIFFKTARFLLSIIKCSNNKAVSPAF